MAGRRDVISGRSAERDAPIAAIFRLSQYIIRPGAFRAVHSERTLVADIDRPAGLRQYLARAIASCMEQLPRHGFAGAPPLGTILGGGNVDGSIVSAAPHALGPPQ